MYQIVMGVGPDDESVPDKVAAVADLPEATESVAVTVVHATDEPDADVTDVDSVAETLAACRKADIRVEAVGVETDPTEAVLATAERRDADCVCVGGRRRSPAGKLQLKAGAEEVILRADRPVLVAGRAE